MTSTRGASGGYRLVRPPEEITVWQGDPGSRSRLPARELLRLPPRRAKRLRAHDGVRDPVIVAPGRESLRATLEGITLASLLGEVEAQVELPVVDGPGPRPALGG